MDSLKTLAKDSLVLASQGVAGVISVQALQPQPSTVSTVLQVLIALGSAVPVIEKLFKAVKGLVKKR